MEEVSSRFVDWHRIWPELIGTEGAPPIAANAEPIGAGEVRDAA